MVINKHSSFYMREGWGTKIIQAVAQDAHIFSPSKEQDAVDRIGIGRIMIKALRYWSVAMGLTNENKDQEGIVQVPNKIFNEIKRNDQFFQRQGSMLLLHRNLVLNKDEATAWYWFFNIWNNPSISKDEFVEAFHAYLVVNEMNIRKGAVDKEFNCLRSTYIDEVRFNLKNIMDEDTHPFFGPLGILYVDEKKRIVKRTLTSKDVPVDLMIYAIAMDNKNESSVCGAISIDKLMEESGQVGKYFNIRYSKLIEILLEAENRGYISLINNFGNRYVEFSEKNYGDFLDKYFTGR